MDPVLTRLREGALRFQKSVYAANADAYRRAASQPQRPDALLVTCADSRIDPELITQSGPGEIFVTRNIGNVVPAYGEMLGGVSAVIEYAVSALGVRHIVICGHSDCGAMKAMLTAESLDAMATVKRWLRNAEAALTVVRSSAAAEEDFAASLRRLTEENVLLQLQHLRTHPSVAGAIARGALTLSGWVYEIGSGEVRIAEDGGRPFIPVGQDAT